MSGADEVRPSIERAESASSASLLTPTSSTSSRPTYADQHNITPEPETRQRVTENGRVVDAEGRKTFLSERYLH